MWWARYIAIAELLLVIGVIVFYHLSAGYRLALGRCPCPQAAAFGAGMEIGVAGLIAYLADSAFYAHLALQFFPEEQQCCTIVRGYLPAFSAVVVGKKGKSTVFYAFQQYCSCVRFVVAIYSGQGHRIHLGYLSFLRFAKPLQEEGHRVVTCYAFIQCSKGVILPDMGNMNGVMRQGDYFLSPAPRYFTIT